jgi:hypothetical protein
MSQLDVLGLLAAAGILADDGVLSAGAFDLKSFSTMLVSSN